MRIQSGSIFGEILLCVFAVAARKGNVGCNITFANATDQRPSRSAKTTESKNAVGLGSGVAPACPID